MWWRRLRHLLSRRFHARGKYVDVEDIISDILRREGGYVDNPHDRGGPTKYGITQGTLARYSEKAVTAEDVEALTPDIARKIYREEYIEAPGYANLDDESLQSLMVDSAVQHGPARATAWLQKTLGVTADGVIGPITMEAYRDSNPCHVYLGVLKRRLKFYGDIIAGNETQRMFSAGWFRRVSDVIDA